VFSKIVSRLAFSPSAINQLAFYGQRLKKEESIRRLGLVFIVLSMFVQISAAMFPAEKSLAASDNDVIRGGVKSITQLKSKYDSHADVRELYNRFGLDGDDINKNRAKNVTFKFKEQGSRGTRTVGRINFASTRDHNLGSFAGSTFYSRSASEWQGSTPAYYFGKQKSSVDGKMYYVWVLKDCGNIAYRPADSTQTPPPKTPPKTPPQVVPKVACTRLTADKTVGKKTVTVRFTGQYYANQDNLVNGLTFDFGDGTKIRHNGPIIDHTYTNDSLRQKKYTARLIVNSTAGDKRSDACTVSITLLPEVCELNPNLRPDDPKCGICPYNSNLAPDDPRCKAEPVCINNPALKPDDPKCKCPSNPEITADDLSCSPPSNLKKARNITQNLSPEKTLTVNAKAGNVIEYSLITTNPNIVARSGVTVEDYIGDLLDYAEVDQAFLSTQGGTFVANTKIVRWENQTIPAHGELEKKFRIVMKNPLPSTNKPNATASDFDCQLENSYGNDTIIPVECPVLKQVETLPNTGPGATIAAAFSITTLSGYFFARARLLSKEVGIIKKVYQHSA
jgi:hypothetical protein